MITVENEIFYHIQKLDMGRLPWSIGDKFEIGKTKNLHIAYYDTYSALNKDPVEVCQEYYTFAKEYVFEEVRADKFPECPSRFNCIWLIPNTPLLQNSINYWLKMLINMDHGYAGCLILGLRCTGKAHYANEQFFINNPWSCFNDLRLSATKYWQGVDAAPELVTTEVLFEGTLTVDHIFTFGEPV